MSILGSHIVFRISFPNNFNAIYNKIQIPCTTLVPEALCLNIICSSLDQVISDPL